MQVPVSCGQALIFAINATGGVKPPGECANAPLTTRTAGDWTRRPRCLPHELCRSRRPSCGKGSRRRTCAGDQRDRETLTSAEDANRARVPLVNERQPATRSAFSSAGPNSVKPPGRPKPRWHQVDRQQRHDRQQLVDIGAHALWRGLHPGDDPDLAADAISQSRKRLPIGRAVVRGGGGLE